MEDLREKKSQPGEQPQHNPAPTHDNADPGKGFSLFGAWFTADLPKGKHAGDQRNNHTQIPHRYENAVGHKKGH